MDTTLRIFIVSSNNENRHALQSILNRQACKTQFASSVTECERLLPFQDVDLLFCDRCLADGTYHDVLRIIRSAKPSLPVIVTSPFADWSQYLEALDAGAYDLIAAPCQLTDVVWMITRAQREGQKDQDDPPKKARRAGVGGDS